MWYRYARKKEKRKKENLPQRILFQVLEFNHISLSMQLSILDILAWKVENKGVDILSSFIKLEQKFTVSIKDAWKDDFAQLKAGSRSMVSLGYEQNPP